MGHISSERLKAIESCLKTMFKEKYPDRVIDVIARPVAMTHVNAFVTLDTVEGPVILGSACGCTEGVSDEQVAGRIFERVIPLVRDSLKIYSNTTVRVKK